MAAVPVTIVGIETREDGSSGTVTIVGMASLTGLGVGGGPMPPGQGGGGGGGGPPHIWGPPDMPPGFWGGGMGPGVKPQPHPEHPIVLPPEQPPPTGEADEDGFIKPPPPEGGWCYHEDHGWLYAPGTGGATPKSGSQSSGGGQQR